MIKADFGIKFIDLGQKLDKARVAKAAFALAGLALASAAILAASSAKAQTVPGYANQFSQPYGASSASMMMPYDAGTRDLNANRVIVDGVIMTGADLSSLPLGIYNASSTGMGYSGVTGYAIGNQLNVNTSGSFNTVVVNSSQVNNGNQTVIINGSSACGTSSCPTAASASTPVATTQQTNQTQVLNGGLNF